MQSLAKEHGQATATLPAWAPICCKQEMHQLIRRAILHSDGRVVYCGVWQCQCCGRLLL